MMEEVVTVVTNKFSLPKSRIRSSVQSTEDVKDLVWAPERLEIPLYSLWKMLQQQKVERITQLIRGIVSALDSDAVFVVPCIIYI